MIATGVSAFFLSSPSIAVASTEKAPTPADLASLQRQAFKAAAVQAMRVNRLSNIGRLCHLLSPEQDAAIRRHAQAMVDDERSLLAPEDRGFAEAYSEGLQDGAFRAADLFDQIGEENCRRFAAPDGPLEKIKTWQGR
ncbi:hypothetical protein [Sphingomonas sp.]|uniref:hypothetical protein n=1 Tax=Sphingomonas sp. TaxID=28214 RepID=UPI003B3B5D03